MTCTNRRINDLDGNTIYWKDLEIDYVQGEVCTKYMSCMGKKQLGDGLEGQVSFEIPQSLLVEEEPFQIQMLPTVIQRNGNYEVEMLVQENIKRKMRQEKQKRKEEQQKKLIMKKKLQQFNQKALEMGKNCKKKQLSTQTRKDWNHQVFGQKSNNKGGDSENNQNKKKDDIGKEDKRISLKPIDERILEHKNKQEARKEKAQKLLECNHYHNSGNRRTIDMKIDVQQRAVKILKAMREQKEKEQERKKIIKAKMKGIQIQSKESLKKFKKKPVDPAVQFVLDIQQSNEKKEEKNEKDTGIQQRRISIKGNDEDKKQKNKKRYLREKKSPRIQMREKLDDQAKRIQDEKIKNERREQGQNEGKREYDKFYVWDIPIYKDDLKKVQINQIKQKQTNDVSDKKCISFREEVRQFLTHKFHNQMEKQNKRRKEERFQELVRQKKQQLIMELNGHTQIFQEQFWNQDQIFKLEPISNFQQF